MTTPVTAPAAVSVELRGVAHRYATSRGPIAALAPTSLLLAAGEFVSIIGPSGCGKSTLLRAVAGLLTPDSGTIMVGGVPAADARRQHWVGWVPQTPSLLPWRRVRDNAASLTDGSKHVDRLLEEVELGGFGDAWPRELSLGMQQRVALVRALAIEPRLLLLDEPFSALDALLREEMQGLLLALAARRGVTTLLVTHSIDEAVRLAGRVIVLSPRPGRVVADIGVPPEAGRDAAALDSAAFRAVTRTVRRALDAVVA